MAEGPGAQRGPPAESSTPPAPGAPARERPPSDSAEALLPNDAHLLEVAASACESSSTKGTPGAPAAERPPSGSGGALLPNDAYLLELTASACRSSSSSACRRPKAAAPASAAEIVALEAPKKRRKAQPRPVEARRAGAAGPWTRFEHAEGASRATGVSVTEVEAGCCSRGAQADWEFRWAEGASFWEEVSALACAGAVRGEADAAECKDDPGAEPANSQEDSLVPVPDDLEGLAARIRGMEPAQRRAAVAALPEAKRRALAQHLRGGREEAAGGSRLRQLLARLPKLLPAAKLEERRALLEGIRNLHARHCELLAAPDVATVASILRGVTPEQRQALLETLPEGTQHALREHLLAERMVARAETALAEGLGACGGGA